MEAGSWGVVFGSVTKAMLIDLITQDDWIIKDWKIFFSLHDKRLISINRSATVRNWYEDEVMNQIWRQRLASGMLSMRRYYDKFGVLPQVGDRLHDYNTGLLILERELNGESDLIIFLISS